MSARIFLLPPQLWHRFRQVVVLIYGCSFAVTIRAVLGIDAWETLHPGVSVITGVPLGVVVMLVGAGVLLLWIPLRQKLGIGTVLNVLIIGLAIDLS